MLHVLIFRSGSYHQQNIAQKTVSNSEKLYAFIQKYYRKYKYDTRYRVSIYSNDRDGIEFIVDKFMPLSYKENNTITDISIELTLDMMPVIAEINCDNYHYYDFHFDCINLDQGDIVYSLKDNRYFLIREDPNTMSIGDAVRDANDCNSNYTLSRLDIRKVSEKEIKLYGLDKLKDIYYTSTSYEEFNKRLAELKDKYPRLV